MALKFERFKLPVLYHYKSHLNDGMCRGHHHPFDNVSIWFRCCIAEGKRDDHQKRNTNGDHFRSLKSEFSNQATRKGRGSSLDPFCVPVRVGCYSFTTFSPSPSASIRTRSPGSTVPASTSFESRLVTSRCSSLFRGLAPNEGS